MKREKWGSLGWLVIGIAICGGGYHLTVGTFNNPGPGFLPFITGLILTTLALILFFNTDIKKEKKGSETPLFPNKKRAGKAIFTIVALLAYAIGMDYLGFIASTAVFMIYLFWMIAGQRWYIAIIGSVSVSLCAYVIFEIFLNSQLPVGIFGD